MDKSIPNHMHCSFITHLAGYNFIPHLQIPIEFLKKQAKNMCRDVKLVSKDGKSRIVKIEKIGKEYFFTTGWKNLAEKMNLKNGEFLLFKLVNKSKFHVWVYGNNGYYNELRSSGDEQDSETENEDDEMEDSENSKNLTLKLTKDHESELELSKDLVKDTNMSGGEKLDLVEDKGRRLGRVFIMERRGKLYMAAGWNDFLVRNKIFVGSTVSLDFVQGSSNIIKVKFVKSKDGGELFCISKRGRGRPPKLNQKK